MHPLLKKAGLDPSPSSNFRTISILPFISKILQKILHSVNTILENNGITDLLQCGFKALHSIESALLKVSNDILLATDFGWFIVLVLLDLFAAFDTVYHSILISYLEHCVAIKGVALAWFHS